MVSTGNKFYDVLPKRTKSQPNQKRHRHLAFLQFPQGQRRQRIEHHRPRRDRQETKAIEQGRKRRAQGAAKRERRQRGSGVDSGVDEHNKIIALGVFFANARGQSRPGFGAPKAYRVGAALSLSKGAAHRQSLATQMAAARARAASAGSNRPAAW